MTETAALSEPVKARSGGAAIFLCLLVAMLEGFDIQAIGLVGAKLAEVAGLSKGELGFVFAMTNVGLVVGAAAGGWLADRFGRKPTLIASCLVFGAFTLATIWTADYNSLLAVRILTGLGLGSALPSMMAISAEVSTPASRASVATMIFAGTPFGGALSAIFVANLPAHADWRLVFVVGGIAPVLIAGVILLLMQETRSAHAAAAGRGVRGGRVLHALFGENRTAATLLIWLALFPTLMILYILLNWLPAFSAEKGFAKPLELAFAGLHLGVNANFTFNLSSVVGALILGYVADRFGFRWPLILAYVGLLAALLALAGVAQLPALLAYAGMAGFFILGAQYAFYGVAASYYPEAVRGVGSGFAVAVGRVGAILGPIAAGQLLELKWSASQVIFAMAPMAAVAGAAVLALSFQKRPAGEAG